MKNRNPRKNIDYLPKDDRKNSFQDLDFVCAFSSLIWVCTWMFYLLYCSGSQRGYLWYPCLPLKSLGYNQLLNFVFLLQADWSDSCFQTFLEPRVLQIKIKIEKAFRDGCCLLLELWNFNGLYFVMFDYVSNLFLTLKFERN